MTEAPFFSVIVPTHKRAGLLRRALTSIRSQESPVPFEVIVISDAIDGNTDAVCAEILTRDDVYIRRNGPPGPSTSRNLALSQVQGRYVMFLDDDDAWHPGYLARLAAHQEVQRGLPVYGDCSIVTERRGPEGPVTLAEVGLIMKGCLTDGVYVKNQVHMSCFAFPRTLLIGLEFDPFMRAYEDWDFLLSVFDRKMATYTPGLCSRVFEVTDATTDRRGDSPQATGINAVMDYLYVYRRHPSPSPEVSQKRSDLFHQCGLPFGPQDLA